MTDKYSIELTRMCLHDLHWSRPTPNTLCSANLHPKFIHCNIFEFSLPSELGLSTTIYCGVLLVVHSNLDMVADAFIVNKAMSFPGYPEAIVVRLTHHILYSAHL